MRGNARVSPPVGSGSGVAAICCISSNDIRGNARVSPPNAPLSNGVSIVGCGSVAAGAEKMSASCVGNAGGGASTGVVSSAHGDVSAANASGSGTGSAAGAAGGALCAAAISSSTLEMRLCDSNGFVTTASQPALSARSGSNGSNVPVRRMTGMLRNSGCDFTYSQTS